MEDMDKYEMFDRMCKVLEDITETSEQLFKLGYDINQMGHYGDGIMYELLSHALRNTEMVLRDETKTLTGEIEL